MGTARPRENANNSTAPKPGEPTPAATPSRTTSAGVQNGQIATGEKRVLDVDNVIVCAGQDSHRDLLDALRLRGLEVHPIGGADVAAELDAVRAIDQATRLTVSF